MHPHHALFQFRDVLRALAPLSDAHQVLLLKAELLHALERADRAQRQHRVLELDLYRLRTRTAARHQEFDVHRAELERQLSELQRELAHSQAHGQEQLHAMRLEVLATEAQCAALDEVCRSLLLTIDQAACSELPFETEAGRTAGVSA